MMPHLPLTYTLAVAPCLTFGGRTIETVGGATDGFGGGRDEAFFIPPSTDLKWLRTKAHAHEGSAPSCAPIGRRRTGAPTEKRLLS